MSKRLFTGVGAVIGLVCIGVANHKEISKSISDLDVTGKVKKFTQDKINKYSKKISDDDEELEKITVINVDASVDEENK